MAKINVILKRSGEDPKPISIENDLSLMEFIVEGEVAILRLGHEICALINKDEHQLIFQKNIKIQGNVIHGHIIFIKAFQDTFVSLDLKDIKTVTKILNDAKI